MTIAETTQRLMAYLHEDGLNEINFLGETTLEIRKERIQEALLFLKQQAGYAVLMDLTGVDYLNPPRTKVVYWLHNPSTLERLRLVVFVGREEALPSVISIWEGADWYERELFDLFGVKIEGHPDLTRILMPDDWSGHPLRRDYPLTEEPVQFKHGVKPKIPSEIIHVNRKQKLL